MKVYCVFCKSGSEDIIAEKIAAISPGLDTIIPVRAIKEKRKGIWESRREHLIPGYIFLYDRENLGIQGITQLTDVYKILKYGTGAKELQGSDYNYAMWIYSHCGDIKESKIIYEGSRVIVIDGPLLNVVGTIVKIDRHKRKAWVEFDFFTKKHVMALSIEDVTSYVA